MSAPAEFTVDQVQQAIGEALGAGDVEAVPGLLAYLSTIDPHAAYAVLQTIEVGLRIASAAAAPSPAPDAAEHGAGVDGGTGVAGKSALLSPPEERAQHAPPAGGPHINPQ